MAWFYTLLWPFTRISSAVLAAPIFSSALISLRIRVAFALAFTLLIYPLHDWPIIDVSTGHGLILFLEQILLGVLLGFILQLAFSAISAAGEFIAMSMGLGFAIMADPVNGQQSPVVSQFLLILGTLIFLGTGGHLVLIEMVLDSFRLIPIDQSYVTVDIVWSLVQWSVIMFVGAMTIALPALITLLLIHFALGVVSRAAPSLNVFAVGFPATLMIGLVTIYILIPAFGVGMEKLWFEGYLHMRALLGIS